AALDSILSNGPLDINVKVIFEGEEEIGSPNLEAFIQENRELLACDIILNPDTGMMDRNTPTITFGLRGIAYFEIRLHGPVRDLHSGSFGGIIHNPAQVLCELIAGMHDEFGRITLPGFYDKVIPLSAGEREELARIPLSDAVYKEQTGVTGFWGEAGYSNIERVGARPTLEVNGLLSGYTGQGSKTVIPAYAMAKISMRLVPNQTPSDVHTMLNEYLTNTVPDTVRWELIPLNSGEPSLSPIDTPAVNAMAEALENIWGTRPIFKREGGSIPVTAIFQKALNSESVLTGFGLPEDNIHSPNEHLHIPTWRCGTQALIHFFLNISDLQVVSK
ncbi:MAG: M20/M25/M40 family metallo-hydrolase, partial [Anaerolineae bacterium]|nr:M20/M25/M40 family metallo-hydrolase [Anaerolineae bacterium]